MAGNTIKGDISQRPVRQQEAGVCAVGQSIIQEKPGFFQEVATIAEVGPQGVLLKYRDRRIRNIWVPVRDLLGQIRGGAKEGWKLARPDPNWNGGWNEIDISKTKDFAKVDAILVQLDALAVLSDPLKAKSAALESIRAQLSEVQKTTQEALAQYQKSREGKISTTVNSFAQGEFVETGRAADSKESRIWQQRLARIEERLRMIDQALANLGANRSMGEGIDPRRLWLEPALARLVREEALRRPLSLAEQVQMELARMKKLNAGGDWEEALASFATLQATYLSRQKGVMRQEDGSPSFTHQLNQMIASGALGTKLPLIVTANDLEAIRKDIDVGNLSVARQRGLSSPTFGERDFIDARKVDAEMARLAALENRDGSGIRPLHSAQELAYAILDEQRASPELKTLRALATGLVEMVDDPGFLAMVAAGYLAGGLVAAPLEARLVAGGLQGTRLQAAKLAIHGVAFHNIYTVLQLPHTGLEKADFSLQGNLHAIGIMWWLGRLQKSYAQHVMPKYFGALEGHAAARSALTLFGTKTTEAVGLAAPSVAAGTFTEGLHYFSGDTRAARLIGQPNFASDMMEAIKFTIAYGAFHAARSHRSSAQEGFKLATERLNHLREQLTAASNPREQARLEAQAQTALLRLLKANETVLQEAMDNVAQQARLFPEDMTITRRLTQLGQAKRKLTRGIHAIEQAREAVAQALREKGWQGRAEPRINEVARRMQMPRDPARLEAGAIGDEALPARPGPRVWEIIGTGEKLTGGTREVAHDPDYDLRLAIFVATDETKPLLEGEYHARVFINGGDQGEVTLKIHSDGKGEVVGGSRRLSPFRNGGREIARQEIFAALQRWTRRYNADTGRSEAGSIEIPDGLVRFGRRIGLAAAAAMGVIGSEGKGTAGRHKVSDKMRGRLGEAVSAYLDQVLGDYDTNAQTRAALAKALKGGDFAKALALLAEGPAIHIVTPQARQYKPASRNAVIISHAHWKDPRFLTAVQTLADLAKDKAGFNPDQAARVDVMVARAKTLAQPPARRNPPVDLGPDQILSSPTTVAPSAGPAAPPPPKPEMPGLRRPLAGFDKGQGTVAVAGEIIDGRPVRRRQATDRFRGLPSLSNKQRDPEAGSVEVPEWARKLGESFLEGARRLLKQRSEGEAVSPAEAVSFDSMGDFLRWTLGAERAKKQPGQVLTSLLSQGHKGILTRGVPFIPLDHPMGRRFIVDTVRKLRADGQLTDEMVDLLLLRGMDPHGQLRVSTGELPSPEGRKVRLDGWLGDRVVDESWEGPSAIQIGRSEGDLTFSGEKSISRRHARIYFENEAWWIEDQSSFGVYRLARGPHEVRCKDDGATAEVFSVWKKVDGKEQIQPGDVLRIGQDSMGLLVQLSVKARARDVVEAWEGEDTAGVAGQRLFDGRQSEQAPPPGTSAALPPNFAQRLFDGVRSPDLRKSMQGQWPQGRGGVNEPLTNDNIGLWLGKVFGQLYNPAQAAARGEEDISILVAFAELARMIQKAENYGIEVPNFVRFREQALALAAKALNAH